MSKGLRLGAPHSPRPGKLTTLLAGASGKNIPFETIQGRAQTNMRIAAILIALGGITGSFLWHQKNLSEQPPATAGYGLQLPNPEDNEELKCLREAAHDAALGPPSLFGNGWLEDNCDPTTIGAIEESPNPLATAAAARRKLLEQAGKDGNQETWMEESGSGEPDKFVIRTERPDKSIEESAFQR